MAEPLILKAGAALTVWVASGLDAERLTQGQTPGPATVNHRPASGQGPLLPPAMGDMRDEFTVPRGAARAYDLAPGEYVQIIDVEGQQCSDFMAFSARGLEAGREEMIDSTATRSMVRRSFPEPGLFVKIYDAQMRPLLNLVQDTCGRHDTFGLACTARSYEERGFPGRLNCSDNISDAMAPSGVARRNAWPAINFFWNTWIDGGSHHIRTEESWSRPGDFVTLRAMEPLV